MEKASYAYHDDEKQSSPPSYVMVERSFDPKQKRRWIPSSSTMLLTIIAFLVTAQVVQNTLPAFRHQCPTPEIHTATRPAAMDCPVHSGSSSKNTFHGGLSTNAENNDPGFNTQDTRPGLSLAATIDSYSNQFLYDLGSSGGLLFRQLAKGSTTWSEPQSIRLDPPAKGSSPFGGIAWNTNDGDTIHRLYYLNAYNRIVEYGATCKVSSSCSWSRTYSFTYASGGGLSASYVPALDSIKIYYPASGYLMQLVWASGGWSSPQTVDPEEDEEGTSWT
ncbi:MAG: hypothetical protein Q9219_003555 [cf. Caloplaca sp. 3 TL-2023]